MGRLRFKGSSLIEFAMLMGKRIMEGWVKGCVKEAVEEYNHFRRPEAEAEIAELKGEEFTVIFKGPFCRSCGIYDYFEDLIYTLKRKGGIDSEILDLAEEDGAFRVKYRIRTHGGDDRT